MGCYPATSNRNTCKTLLGNTWLEDTRSRFSYHTDGTMLRVKAALKTAPLWLVVLTTGSVCFSVRALGGSAADAKTCTVFAATYAGKTYFGSNLELRIGKTAIAPERWSGFWKAWHVSETAASIVQRSSTRWTRQYELEGR
jgi:hypothetical protein